MERGMHHLSPVERAALVALFVILCALILFPGGPKKTAPPAKPRHRKFWHGWPSFAVLALAAALPAQVVTVANLTGQPFAGWKRTTIDALPPSPAGKVGDTLFVVGRPVGLNTHVVDLHVSLAAGQTLTLDLAAADDVHWSPAPLPADPLAWFGGIATLNGAPMSWVGLQRDGAGYTAHLRARTGRMLHTDLWVTWYPDQPGWCHGEAFVTCSNPAVPDLTATLPPPGLVLAFGDAQVGVLGGAPAQLVAPGTTFADGQARLIPLTFVWQRHLRDASEWSSVGCAVSCGVGARGIAQLLAEGNPTLPVGFAPAPWLAARWQESIRRLHTWEAGVLGIPKESGQTGRQEDQVRVRGEAFAPGGVGCEWLAYFAAAKWANRPCHHLEADGSLLRMPHAGAGLPIMWDGRPHGQLWDVVDRLGKSQALTLAQAGGWRGPDVEHWLINGLAAGARLTGSPALQHLLSAQAVIYPLQHTVAVGWSTSQAYAARAIGYEGMNVVHLWRELEDRALAAAVREHWLRRWSLVLRPHIGRQVNQFPSGVFLDCRENDPRLGAGWWWIPWQQSVGAFGLDEAGREFDVPAAREWALRAALQVVADAWVEAPGGGWHSQPNHPVIGETIADGSFNYYGMALAPAVVLRHQPDHAKARAIWNWLIASARTDADVSWLVPGVL
jgi:hypothetical protein